MEGDELEERIAKLKLALNEVRKKWKESEELREKLSQQELFILGQIKEREFDVPDVPNLPIYNKKEDLEKAIKNRGKDLFGRPQEELNADRQSLMEKEAKGTADYIDKVQKDNPQGECVFSSLSCAKRTRAGRGTTGGL